MKALPFYLFAFLLFFVGCSTIDCPVDSSVRTKYQIRDSYGQELTLTDTITIVSTRFDGKDTSLIDPTLYNKGVDISEFSIPISYTHPEDELVFHFDNGNIDRHIVDTVWIKKEDYAHFESIDCNSAYFHNVTDVRYTRNYIDSLVINNPSVTYDSQTVHFYLYPKSNL